jgi:hypothetical protein
MENRYFVSPELHLPSDGIGVLFRATHEVGKELMNNVQYLHQTLPARRV